MVSKCLNKKFRMMKRFAIILIITFVIGLVVSSCKTQGPPCPAYGKADKATIEKKA